MLTSSTEGSAIYAQVWESERAQRVPELEMAWQELSTRCR